MASNKIFGVGVRDDSYEMTDRAAEADKRDCDRLVIVSDMVVAVVEEVVKVVEVSPAPNRLFLRRWWDDGLVVWQLMIILSRGLPSAMNKAPKLLVTHLTQSL